MSMSLAIKVVLLGYFLAGYYAVLKVSLAPHHERPLFMMRPNIFKKLFWGLSWPIHAYIETYYIHMPDKPRAIVYGILTVPVLLLGFSIFSGLVISPHYFIDSSLLAILVSMIILVVGSIVLMPIIAFICTGITMLIAQPILIFFPKKEIKDTGNDQKE